MAEKTKFMCEECSLYARCCLEINSTDCKMSRKETGTDAPVNLTEPQAHIVLALAANNINVSATAKAIHYGRSTMEYHLHQIRERTGLNPQNFYDLQKLVIMAKTMA